MKILSFCSIGKTAVYQYGSDFRTFVYYSDEVFETTGGVVKPMNFKGYLESQKDSNVRLDGRELVLNIEEKKRFFILSQLKVDLVRYDKPPIERVESDAHEEFFEELLGIGQKLMKKIGS